MATVAIIEDHSIVREGIHALLQKKTDHSVVAETDNGLKALELIESTHPDLAIVDLRLPGLDGLEVVRRSRENSPSTRVIVLSMHANASFVARAFKYGALAYVLKNTAVEDLPRAIEAALKNERFVSDDIEYVHDEADGIKDAYDTLTDRERETLQLVADGLTASQIADRLFISSRTVEKHRANLMKKLGLHNHAEVVRYALERGLSPFRLPGGS